MRHMLLEDQERVIMIRKARKNVQYRSNQPHSGSWSKTQDYILIPCKNPKRKENIILRTAEDHNLLLENRSSEAEVLVLGAPASIKFLLEPRSFLLPRQEEA